MEEKFEAFLYFCNFSFNNRQFIANLKTFSTYRNEYFLFLMYHIEDFVLTPHKTHIYTNSSILSLGQTLIPFGTTPKAIYFSSHRKSFFLKRQ